MLKDYNAALGKYIKNTLGINVIEAKRETSFEMISKHHDQEKVTFPFVSFFMSGDVELDAVRYNAYVHRVGIVVNNDINEKKAVRVRAVPIIHPYVIDIWSKSKDTLENYQKTFWITLLDNPVINIFSRETHRTYRAVLNVMNSVNENITQAEERAGYFNSTVSVGLSVWIRLSYEVKTISKAIVEYIQDPENYVLSFKEYTGSSFT